MNRSGGGPQPLRGIPSNVFQNQSSSTQRNGVFGSSRLQNGKLTSATGWGVNMAGAPNLPNSQSRNSSFAQTIGGSQSQGPLDLSEFPSLSGAPQSQQQSSSSQAIWGNPGLRSGQNQPNQRSQTQHNSASQPAQTQNQNSQSHQAQHTDNQVDNHSHFAQSGGGGMDDYRYGQSITGQSSRMSEQQGQSDDFPPLGGLGGADMGQPRRNDSGPGGRFNGLSDAGGYGDIQSQSRNGVPSQFDGRQDAIPQSGVGNRMISPSDVNPRVTAMSRSPLGVMQSDQDRSQRSESGSRILQGTSSSNYPVQQPSQMPFRSPDTADYGPPRFPSTNPPPVDDLTSDSHLPDQQYPITQMTESERWGLQGLLSTLRGENGPDQASLALGVDLSTLGLDLNRSSPLYKDWAGPFADASQRPIIPEFQLPPAYTVPNVPPLETKIGSFSDETLFVIFYQNPRDEAQELAANELYSRDWRWHKKLRQWMMKAKEYGEPVVSPTKTEERGWYYFWDAQNWRRERKEFILAYADLHHQSPQTMPTINLSYAGVSSASREEIPKKKDPKKESPKKESSRIKTNEEMLRDYNPIFNPFR